MRKLNYLVCFTLIAAVVSCKTNTNHTRVSEPVSAVAQTINGDTVVTFYEGERPYKMNQQINTRIKFVRNLNENLGRFYLDEVYLNKKDSVKQHYQGTGNYKILPAPNGGVQGIALYDMLLDDKSKGYMYLLKDSVTLVKVDEKGNELNGSDAVVLKSYNKK